MNIHIKQIQNQRILKCKINRQIIYSKYGFKTSVKIRIKNKFQNMDQTMWIQNKLKYGLKQVSKHGSNNVGSKQVKIRIKNKD